MNTCIPLNEFQETFQIIPNSANGDCLFESLCFALPQKIHFKLTPKELRQDLAKAYTQLLSFKDFQNDEPLKDDLLNKIKLGIMYDNDEEDGQKHHEKISKTHVWASMTDVLLLGFMMHVDIFLLTLNDETMQVDNMTNLELPRGAVLLYYSNNEHFEAVIPKGTPIYKEQLENLRVAELKQLCKERNIEDCNKMRKSELIQALTFVS